ncbi:alpha/beta hydrolase family protein [Mycolicibacterium confluentis]|uniref:Alpha/beta hydrolase n=1 Tax=Mycolicibacterium confluentis TaxID=28047 RepID=A0A7I7Y0Y2_9MYCO|nr:hypothetical protein [Mycolicibacterium confluentis]MCV7320211.1 hypothetical protein [Mycolicibacterium confluentis]BBZ35247.1 hypothetical protein MCNF_38520 [Mycolicibacterium confluentis]
MARVSGWLSVGVVATGLSMSVLVGAGAAGANTGGDSDAGGDRGPSSAADSGPQRPAARDLRTSLRDLRTRAERSTEVETRAGTAVGADGTAAPPKPRRTPTDRGLDGLREAAESVKELGEQAVSRIEASLDRAGQSVAGQVAGERAHESDPRPAAHKDIAAIPDRVREALRATPRRQAVEGAVAQHWVTKDADGPTGRAVETGVGIAADALAGTDAGSEPTFTVERTVSESSTTAVPTTQAVLRRPLARLDEVAARLIDPIGRALLDPTRTETPRPVTVLSTVLFTIYSALTRVLEGPPAVPPNLRDRVQVSSSTLEITEGNEVPADWYLPIRAEGEPAPDRLIHLQHGFLANGPMYSYTAAILADRTNSVVVVTSLTSNPFAAGGIWLGGDAMHKAVADLYLDDDRTALNDSLRTALDKAGRDDITLPDRFVLTGHSLGGGFAPGVAGHYAEGLLLKRETDPDAPNQLAGVIVYDAVPISPIMPNAMARLAALEASGDPSGYVPVYELGAPLNPLNMFSHVDGELSDARPGKFNGVVLVGGVHMDAMLGHNPLTQTLAYLIAGIPQRQNPLAVQDLSVGWIDDMFSGRVDPATGKCEDDCAGQYAGPGQRFTVETAAGAATAVVIDSRPGADRPGVVTQLVNLIVSNVTGALLGAPSSPGPGVTVGTSALQISEGRTVEADWYFPDAEPTGVIYLQHGFFRSNDNVSALAADLARSTGAVVVAPSMSSNFLTADGFWINGAPTQQAVATLFSGDRAALSASAAAAGFTGELPSEFVLAGHSAGGNLVTAAAGYLAASGADLGDFKGVVLLDAVDGGGAMRTGLRRLESTGVPVYQIAAEPCLCNAFGSGTDVLTSERAGRFVGVLVTGGSHIDAEGVNSGPLAGLVCGYSTPQNSAAVPTLAAGWVADMLADRISPETGVCAGDCAGYYGEPGSTMIGGARVVRLDSGVGARPSHDAVRSPVQVAA